jgi:Zn-dependent protease
MNESIRLGTIAGVRVGANWSVLLIGALIAFGLAVGRFPVQYPDLPSQTYVIAGLVAAVVFFASLLAHEVSHAVVAMRNGLEVEGITLWLFGGVAKLGGEAEDPGADFRIAGVGPLVSAVLGVVFFTLSAIVEGIGFPPIVVGVFSWLALINAVLAVFNLVPAAPLDGGRILRAVLWRRHGDQARASITAARAGKVFGFVLVGLGLLEFAAGAGFGGLWFVLIGWFLINAAGAEEQHAGTRRALGGVRVGDVMTAGPTTAPAHISVADFVDDYLFRYRHSAFPLVDHGGRGAGLITLNRVKQVPSHERATTRLEDIACPADEVAVAGVDDPLVDLLERISRGSDGRALVVEDGQLVGIVSPTDIARRLEIAPLRDPRDHAHV